MKKLASVFAGIAMLMTGAASLGCVLFLIDEPQALKTLID